MHTAYVCVCKKYGIHTGSYAVEQAVYTVVVQVNI